LFDYFNQLFDFFSSATDTESKRYFVKRAKKKSAATAAPANSRELLLKAANKIFSDKGYDQTSTRDIAKLAGVNISLISYHFQGKEGLYRACVEVLSVRGTETVERVLKKPTSLDDFKTRLHIFIEEFFQLHLSNPENSCIIMRELCTSTPNAIAMDLFKHKFAVIFGRLIDFLNYAQKQKYIVSTVDTEIFGTMIMGCITQILRSDMMRKTVLGVPGLLDPDRREKTIAQVTNNLINGVLPR
jgi:AcrR family transcriptional regulator